MFTSLKEDALFQQYLNSGYNYEALLDSDENLRPYWETFFHSFKQLGYAEVNGRQHAMLRLLKENGVTYNIYGDPDGLNRPWKLDIIPFLISKREWPAIESGLLQRAELLNLVLADIYGERRLFRNGILPVEL